MAHAGAVEIDPFIKVSVHVITYNQGKYIREALESVLSQKVNFKYEIVVGDDFSTDSTRSIIQEYADKYKDIVKPLLHPYNLGPKGLEGKYNFIETLYACRGMYVALLEGDDYWNDTNKLQAQIDFLDKHPDYTICFHRVYEKNDDDEPVLSELNTSVEEETYTIEDLAGSSFIHTPSVVFRNGLINGFPKWYYDAPAGDYALHLLNARHGKIKYLPRAMAVYRKHGASVWSVHQRPTILQKWLKVLDLLLEEKFDGSVTEVLKTQRRTYRTEYFKLLFDKDYPLFIQKMEETISDDPELVKEWMLVHYPEMIRKIQSSNTYKLAKRLAAIKAKVIK